jgi:hypothetical protein
MRSLTPLVLLWVLTASGPGAETPGSCVSGDP